MIQLLKTIVDVSDFELQNQIIFILRGGMMNRSVFICDGLNDEKKILENIIIPSFRANDESLWVYSKGKTFEFSKDRNFNNPNIYSDFFPKYKNENTLIGDFKKDDNRYLQSRKLVNEKAVWEINFTSTILLISTQIYLVKFSENLQKLSLFSFDFHTGSPLWQYTLLEEIYDWTDGGGYEHKGEIERIIGVYKGVLWVSLNSGRLLGLSVEGGLLLYNISQPNIYPNGYIFREENKYLWYGRHWQFDAEKGVLFGLTSCYYFELTLSNPSNTFVLYDISASCEQYSIKANMPVLEWSWQGDEIFFGDTDFNRPAQVGIFNRQTKQITWTSQELGTQGIFNGVRKLDYAIDRLYVLDGENTLHIFERETHA